MPVRNALAQECAATSRIDGDAHAVSNRRMDTTAPTGYSGKPIWQKLGIARCEACSICYVFDVLSLPRSACPACVLFARSGTVEPLAAAG